MTVGSSLPVSSTLIPQRAGFEPSPEDVIVLNNGQQSLDVFQGELGYLQQNLCEDHPNLVDVHDAIKRMKSDLQKISETIADIYGYSDIKNVLPSRIEAVQKEVDAIDTQLQCEPFQSLFTEQQKWAEAGFDRTLLKTDPEAVHFAVSTKLIYTIAMFEKSSDILEGDPLTIRKDDAGKALFKVKGEWVPYDSFKDKIQYSEQESRFVGWNYVHPDGFIPRDWAEYNEIYPVAKLKPEAYQKIKVHAEKFRGTGQPEIDPGVPKGYILQVMTTGRNLLPDTWWAKNFRENFPGHGSLRLITPDGEVYSFGIKMRQPDQEFLIKISNYLGSGISNVATPDYEESRNSDDKLMASLPISKERFDRIINFVNRANQGICFNFARQNCIRFAETVLRLSGVEISVKTPISELLSNVMPRISDIPGIGKPLAKGLKKVAGITSAIFSRIANVFNAITPMPIKRAWSFLTDWATSLANGVLRRIENAFWVTFSLCFLGAWKSIVPPSRMNHDDPKEVEIFHHFLDWKDLFNPDALQIYYVTKLREWMKKQKTALLFKSPEHGFCCFDPDKAAMHSPFGEVAQKS
jgi:hypothetical protein